MLKECCNRVSIEHPLWAYITAAIAVSSFLKCRMLVDQDPGCNC